MTINEETLAGLSDAELHSFVSEMQQKQINDIETPHEDFIFDIDEGAKVTEDAEEPAYMRVKVIGLNNDFHYSRKVTKDVFHPQEEI